MHLAINGFFLDKPTTGTGQYTRQLLRGIAEGWPHRLSVLLPPGCDVSLLPPRSEHVTYHVLQNPFGGALATASRPRRQDKPFDGALATASRPRRQDKPFGGNLGKVWFEQITVPRAAAKLGADILHVPYLGSPLRCSLPMVVTVHDLLQLTVPQLRGGPLVRLYNLLAAACARRAAAILADSEYTRETVLAHLRVPPQRVRRVYLAADSRYTPEGGPEERDRIQRRYGLDGQFLLYIGGLDWRKNVSTLVRSYARAGCSLPLAIAGEARSARDSGFPDLEREAERSGVLEQVKFLGWVAEEDKPALYRMAQLFTFPSKYEGFGLTPLEALACGTPVLCSSATSLPEVVGDAALLFDPDDAEGLAQLIRQATTDAALRETLHCKALQQARRFDWHTTAEQTVDTYQRVLHRKDISVG